MSVPVERRVNLSALGDGIIVAGLAIFLLSIGYIYNQSVQQSIANATTADALRSAQQGQAIVAGLLALGASVLVAAALKIAHAFTAFRNDTRSNLKTPVAATAVVFLMFYFTSFFFFFGRF
jgi:hypothetical protein